LNETNLVTGKVIASHNEDATRWFRGARQRQLFEILDCIPAQKEAYGLLQAIVRIDF
jgi:hypothetical protein